MLKIKDNVDLKELEKFGFKYINDKCFISIHYKQAFFITPNEDKIIVPERIIEGNDLDILYDLIKSDLVEKVGEIDNE